MEERTYTKEEIQILIRCFNRISTEQFTDEDIYLLMTLQDKDYKRFDEICDGKFIIE